MPQSEPVTILLVNAIAEEIKLATLTLRRFFPNCRVEAVYTVEEALQWGPRASWQLIVIDEDVIAQRAAPIFSELKRLVPYTTLVLQTDHSDSTTALNALQSGADFILYKKSPGFLDELVLYIRGALETRAIRMTLKQTQERHDRLIDILSDGLYELDVEGRFVYLSPLVTDMLGYRQDELLGILYSAVIPSDQQALAHHRFNDRRTGPRAAQRIEVDLLRKTSADKPAHTRVRAEISARGLYDVNHRYLGTLGLMRDISQHRRQTKTIHQLEHQLRESDQLLAIARRVSTLSKTLHAPHRAIQAQSQLLLKTIRDAHLMEQVDSLATYAAEVVHLGSELIQTAKDIVIRRDTINDIIEAVLTSTQPPLTHTDWIERAYGQNLPPYTGSLDSMVDLVGMLLSHAHRYMVAMGSPHRLRVSTKAISLSGSPVDEETAPIPQATATEFEIHIQETDIMVEVEEPPLQATTGDLFAAYAVIRQLGGRWDFQAPINGFLSIKVWIPVELPPLLDSPSVPVPSAVSSIARAVKRTVETILKTPTHALPPAPLPFTQSTKPLPERRKYIRTAVGLPARVTIGTRLHEGIMVDLSPSGAALEVEGALPSFEQQPVYLLLKTVASIIELDATAYDRGALPRQADIEQRVSRLALEFNALNENQRKILASFIDAAHVRALTITVEAQLPSMDRVGDLAAPFTEAGLPDTDARETVRVRVALQVRIETSNVAAGRLLGLVINFSRGGVCLLTEPFLKMTDEVVALHFSSISTPTQPKQQNPEAPDAILIGRIIHLAPDATAPSKLTPGPSQPRQRIGIRFSQLTPFAEREINRLIAQHIGSSLDVADPDSQPVIVSDRWECRNTHGQAIAVTTDHARHHMSPDTPIVIVIPGFGSTQTDYVPLSFHLAANHLRVLRYDHSNHIGHSEGSVLHITLSSMQTDLQSILDLVHTTWPAAPVTLLAEDITARVAMKVMAQSAAADRLFLLNPVLDLETALSTITCSNVIETYRQGHRRGVVNLWGLNVNFDQFAGDAITGRYVDLASLLADLAQLVTPPIILASPRKNRPIEDIFGPQYEPVRAMETAPPVISLPADLSGESGADDRRTEAFKMILQLISTPLIDSPPLAQSQESNRRDVYQQRQLEHERIRLRYHVSQATRSALWGAHLAHLPQLEHLPNYLGMTNDLYRRLLPLEPGMTVLDIGCGQRHFARLMLTNQAYRSAHHSKRTTVPLRYIGLDQSHESLRLAEQQFHTFAKELPGTLRAAVPTAQLVTTSWMRTDWNAPLPFTNGSIERILCHLSLSFTSSPLHCLRQMLRVLHPDGTVVVTCLQSHTDLSTLFRRHLLAEDHDEFGSPAQIVLHYLGRLREAICHGLLHIYAQDELARLLAHAGAGPIQFFPVLDNQLLLAVVRKTKSAG
ncbi:MAG: PAS domain S-box protein [Nitrospira sp. CG24B]|nr:MAG: PAS domain S-box protein [Nitrospira sp. CG24B]